MEITGWQGSKVTVPFADANSPVSKSLQNWVPPHEWPYGANDFQRRDANNDSLFYNEPRMVTHVDDEAIRALTDFYGLQFSKAARGKFSVLDMCSSHLSHYPKDLQAKRVAITGMNQKELASNKQAHEYFAQDINMNPRLPYGDKEFDFVTNCVSIDYLTKPEYVFREMHRVLKPGGVAIIAFSNRCFPSKAIAVWREDMQDGPGHCQIVGNFFHFCPPAGWREITSIDISQTTKTSPMWVVTAMKAYTLPIPHLRTSGGILGFTAGQKPTLHAANDSEILPPAPPDQELPAARQEALEAASVQANMKPPPEARDMSGSLQCHGINSLSPVRLAMASAGTLAGQLFWQRRYVEVSEALLKFHSREPSERHSKRILTLPLDMIDEVSLNAQIFSVHCRNPQASVQFFAASEPEAASWAAAIKQSVAHALSANLPFGWDVQAMLSMDSYSTARLVHKEFLPAPVIPLCQRLADHCYVCKSTKDRKGRTVPLRLQLIDVQRVQNGAAWIDYSRAKSRLRSSQSSGGQPDMQATQESVMSAAGSSEEAQARGSALRSLSNFPVLTSTLSNTSLTQLLGGELDGSTNEQWLFHGTSMSGVQGISDKEFRLDFAGSHRGTMYGKGIYLAECTSKADEYSEEDDEGYCYMLLCRCLLGKVNHCIDTKPKTDILESTKSRGYDSLLGDRWTAVGTFREFILFDPNQVYPAFILRYRRWGEATFARSLREAVESRDQDAASRIVPLTALLTEEYPDKTARYRLALLLGAHSETAIPELCRSLSDHRFRVRRGCILALLQLAADTGNIKGLPRAVPSLIASLSDESAEIRKCAARTLERLSDHASSAVQTLISCLEDQDGGVRAAASGALGQLGSQAAPSLRRLALLADDAIEQVRVSAVTAIGNIGAQLVTSSEVPILRARLHDPSVEVRCSAATALGQLRSAPGAETIMDLASKLQDLAADVRKAAVKSLGNLGNTAAPALPAMIVCIKDKDPHVRRAAAHAFETLGVHAQPASQALIDGLRDSSEQVRRVCANAMGRLWKKGTVADLPVLLALVRVGLIDQVAEVRSASAQALADFAGMGQLGQHLDVVETAMVIRLKDSDSAVRNAAQAFLAHVRPAKKKEDETWRGDAAKMQGKLAGQMNWRRTEHQMNAIKASGMRN
eukprot:TRINITY_DN72357_c0_g1_i1.p1 TRINITY_DN72357_c0_g1~~TRINITY_DN72357_c0_g1_i1.p1  ORF type:complete len:1153 (-),score=210.81 TRINITY_DN72357_c0_g1_i1:162-3620(-)